MSDWPDGRTDDNRSGNRYGQGSDNDRPESARVMRHVQRPSVPPQPRNAPRGSAPRQRRPEPPQYAPGDNAAYDSGYNTGQVYGDGRRAGGNGGGGGGGGRNDGGRVQGPPPDWRRRIKIGSLALVVVVLVVSIGTYFWADSKLKREVDLSKVIERPEEGDGTNYLIVGSDSREGMTSEDKKKLHTGGPKDNGRTDSMMILHDGSNGPTLISLPRDSKVEIPSFKGSESGKLYPGRGQVTKLNAAYAMDGPELLVRTIEFNTGLRIDHYVEIGFGGFAKIVDAIGGVELDIPKAFKDKKSGADFQAGKQTLNGEESLAFVRTRYAFAEADLARTKNQQKFLAALASQTATPSTILNPFKLYPTMGAGLDTLIVDKDMSLWSLSQMFFAMKDVTGGDGKSMNMPMSGIVGGYVVWDKTKVGQLVEQLKNDEKVTVTGK
ncbi:LCP family protein [Streptomyces sp. NPDC006435]|uniref:LCP family glycopolymer transferase n=1 Tax=Streptomyces sp. NPDC006435 TaxID=3154300 RepID=UPI0033AE9311